MKKARLYRFLRPILTFLFKLVFHPKIVGSENIPKEGRIILAGNHTNIFDSVLLIACTKRTIHFLAKDSLVNGKLGFIFRNVGIIPVNRGIRDGGALRSALRTLNNEKVIGIFPEGTINRTDDVTISFKSGAVRMAFATDSKIIPFAITGKYNIFGKGITITFGKPYTVESDKHKVENEKFRTLINTMIIERR